MMTTTPITQATELKPCPFCGEIPKLGDNGGAGGELWFQINCEGPKCEVQPYAQAFGKPELAIKDWNTRPLEEQALARIRQEQERVKERDEEIEERRGRGVRTYEKLCVLRVKHSDLRAELAALQADHHDGPCKVKDCQRCRAERAEAELAASREEIKRLRREPEEDDGHNLSYDKMAHAIQNNRTKKT